MGDTIQSIDAREILDSRGNPTVETEIILSDKTKACASAPSGVSKGLYEAHELRDGDTNRFHGQGVLKAVKNIKTVIAKKFVGKTLPMLEELDQALIELDRTRNKSRLGANALISVSMAYARALALYQKQPLYQFLRKTYFPRIDTWKMPLCIMNFINGGAHANWTSDIQEYMIITHFPKVKKQIQCGSEIFYTLRGILMAKNINVGVGDEGGFAFPPKNNEEPLRLLTRAITRAEYKENEVGLGIDVAASELYRNGKYEFLSEKKKYSADEMISIYSQWLHSYSLELIEDGLAQDDWNGWKKMTRNLGEKLAIIGDDIFATHSDLLKKGVNCKAGTGIIIKLNQIGTVSEALKTLKEAKKNNYTIVISHRSGETLDDFIVDLACASGAEYLKAGSICRGERIAKYNRLLKIEEELQRKSTRIF